MKIDHLCGEYQKEIKELIKKMEASEEFAKKLPLFSRDILENKNQPDEMYLKFGNYYKGMYLGWGINRGYYKSGTNRYMTNNEEFHDGYFFSIYVNSVSLFDSPSNFGLYEKVERHAYYTDYINSRFYIEDNNIEIFLNSLVEWYDETKYKAAEFNKKEKVRKLELELSKLKGEL